MVNLENEQLVTEFEYKYKTASLISATISNILVMLIFFKFSTTIISECIRSKPKPFQVNRRDIAETQFGPLQRYELAKQANSVVSILNFYLYDKHSSHNIYAAEDTGFFCPGVLCDLWPGFQTGTIKI